MASVVTPSLLHELGFGTAPTQDSVVGTFGMELEPVGSQAFGKGLVPCRLTWPDPWEATAQCRDGFTVMVQLHMGVFPIRQRVGHHARGGGR